jgi:hypothetical protein
MKRIAPQETGPANRDRVFYNGTVILPHCTVEDGVVVCRNGRITAVGFKTRLAIPIEALAVDAHGGYIATRLRHPHARRRRSGFHGWHSRRRDDGALGTCAQRNHYRLPYLDHRLARGGSPNARCVWGLGVRGRQHTARGWGEHFYGPYFSETMVGAHRPGHCRPLRLRGPKAFLVHDIRFHRAVAAACGNPIRASLVEMVSAAFLRTAAAHAEPSAGPAGCRREGTSRSTRLFAIGIALGPS